MEGARRRLGILQHHLAASFGSHDAAGRAALALGLCRAAAAAAAGPPVLVGGAVMDLQASLVQHSGQMYIEPMLKPCL